MATPEASSSLTPPGSPPREEEEEELGPPPAESPPAPAAAPAPFDPLRDMLGMESGFGVSNNAQAYATVQQNMAVQVYNAGGAGMMPGAYQPASMDQSVAERVANVKGIMANSGGTGNQQQRGGFGVDGTNMHVAMHGGPQNLQAQQQAQQQMYAMQQYQQQQQQMAAYQTMAYQTMAYQSMAAGQQLQVYQPNMAQGMQGMYGMQNGMQNGTGLQRMGMNAVGLYVPAPQGNQLVPVMQAEKQVAQPQAFRVQKGTKPTRVSDSDKAFGPILDRLKQDVASRK